MRRFVVLAISASLLLGVSASARLWAQDAAKQDPAKSEQKPEVKPTTEADKPAADAQKPATESAAGEPGKAEAKPAAAPVAPPPLKPIPPEVEAKLEAARRAVAEAIVAAQDAGLVDTTISPPPILDILILGQANDGAVLKAKLDELKADPNASPEAGLSPEVFGAWFSMQGKMDGVDLGKNIRIVHPSKGLLEWYAARAKIFDRHIAEVRKTMGTPEAAKAAETPKDEAKAAETPKDETKPTETPKDEAKPAGTPKEESKPAETPKEESKPAETEKKADDTAKAA